MNMRPDLTESLSVEQLGRSEKIAALNDQLRRGQRGPNDTIIIVADLAAHIASLDPEASIAAQIEIGRTVALYSSFTADNDPHGEHDHGFFQLHGEDLMWKIDYYDLARVAHSPDETDPTVTSRVLTIFYARDY